MHKTTLRSQWNINGFQEIQTLWYNIFLDMKSDVINNHSEK